VTARPRAVARRIRNPRFPARHHGARVWCRKLSNCQSTQNQNRKAPACGASLIRRMHAAQPVRPAASAPPFVASRPTHSDFPTKLSRARQPLLRAGPGVVAPRFDVPRPAVAAPGVRPRRFVRPRFDASGRSKISSRRTAPGEKKVSSCQVLDRNFVSLFDWIAQEWPSCLGLRRSGRRRHRRHDDAFNLTAPPALHIGVYRHKRHSRDDHPHHDEGGLRNPGRTRIFRRFGQLHGVIIGAGLGPRKFCSAALSLAVFFTLPPGRRPRQLGQWKSPPSIQRFNPNELQQSRP